MEREGEEDQDKDGWTQMYQSHRRDISPIPPRRLQKLICPESGGYLFVSHQHYDMIVFTSSDNLLVLAECPVLFMDGTFKVAGVNTRRIYERKLRYEQIYKKVFINCC